MPPRSWRGPENPGSAISSQNPRRSGRRHRMPFAPEKIRNVAFVGHRGSGKTSLAEALLFQAGAVTRLGSVADGTTVSDNDEDEKRRTMSISGSSAARGARRPQAQHLRRARRSELRGRCARRAAGRGGSAVHGLGRRGRRGHDLTALAPLRRARAVACRLHQPSRPRPRRLRRRARVDPGATVAALRRDRDPDRQREGFQRRHRRPAHGRLRRRGRRLARGRAGPDPGGHGRRGGDVARAPGRGGRRGIRRPHGEVPRRRGDQRPTSCARPCTQRCCAASCSPWPAARRRRTRARMRCST